MSTRTAEAVSRGWANMTPEARAERCRRISESNKRRCAAMTDEERAERRARREAGSRRWLASLTPEERAARTAKMRARKAEKRGAPRVRLLTGEASPAAPVPKRPSAVCALLVKGAGASVMARARAILDVGMAAAQQAIAVQLEAALVFVRADAKSRATMDALIDLRRAVEAWDAARGGGQ